MNILFLSHERKMGGANYSLYELTKEIRRRGHNVHVAVLLNTCELAIKLKEENIDTIRCFYGWWQMPRNWNIFLKLSFRFLHFIEFIPLIKLILFIKKANIDIIYSNTSCIDIGAKLSKITGVKHIWHFREFGDSDYNLAYMYGRKKSINIVNKCSDKVIFISRALKEYYNDVNVERSEIVYNGVSKLNVLHDRKKKVDKLIFLVSGNLSRGKNQMLAVKAAKRIWELGIEFELWIAGECTDIKDSINYKKEIINYICENSLENTVRLLGFVEDMRKLRQDVDAEIVPSIREAFGRVTVEAMMAGNLVIASDTGANTELIEDGVTGLIFNSQNIDALEKCMMSVAMGNVDIETIGKRAQIEAIKNYTIDANASNIERILIEVAN